MCFFDCALRLANYYTTLEFEAVTKGVGQDCWENLTAKVKEPVPVSFADTP